MAVTTDTALYERDLTFATDAATGDVWIEHFTCPRCRAENGNRSWLAAYFVCAGCGARLLNGDLERFERGEFNVDAG